MACRKGHSDGSVSDSANNNVRHHQETQSGFQTMEAEGSISSCSTLDRYSTLDRLVREADPTITNSDFEDMCRANDVESDTDTLTGSPRGSPLVAMKQKGFSSTGLNVSKGFISPSCVQDSHPNDYMEQLDELINSPDEISVSQTYDTIGQINIGYLAQLEKPQSMYPRQVFGGSIEGQIGERKDISSSKTHDTIGQIGYLAQLEKPVSKHPRKASGNSMEATVDKSTMDLLAKLDQFGTPSLTPVQSLQPEQEITATSTRDTVGLINTQYMREIERNPSSLNVQVESEMHKMSRSPVQKMVIRTADAQITSSDSDFLRPKSGTSCAIKNKVGLFEKLERRRSGFTVDDDDTLTKKREEDNLIRDDIKEAEERLDSLCADEEEEERNKSVRDAISIFERFRKSLTGDKDSSSIQVDEARHDIGPSIKPVAPGGRQEHASRPSLHQQQAIEQSVDSTLESEKDKYRPRASRGKRIEQANKPDSDISNKSSVKLRSSSADRFTDINRQNMIRRRDLSPRFSAQNRGDPDKPRERPKHRSMSSERLRPVSEYHPKREEDQVVDSQRPVSLHDPKVSKDRISRRDDSGRHKQPGRGRSSQVKSDPEFTYTSDEQELIHASRHHQEKKHRRAYGRHIGQPGIILPLEKDVHRHMQGYHDNHLSPPPPLSPRRRSGDYDRQYQAYDRQHPNIMPSLLPAPYPDLKRRSGDYNRHFEHHDRSDPYHQQMHHDWEVRPRFPPGYERERIYLNYPERRDSPLFRGERGSPQMHEPGPGSPRCFSPHQRPYIERDGSPKCFSPKQWYQEREIRERENRGSPLGRSPYGQHPDGHFQYVPEDDPIYARIQKTSRPYYGPSDPGTFYVHDPMDRWQRNPDPHDCYECRVAHKAHSPYSYPEYWNRNLDDRPPQSLDYPRPNMHQMYYPYHDHRSPQFPYLPEKATPYDNLHDSLAPPLAFPPHSRGHSPTGYHSDNFMHQRHVPQSSYGQNKYGEINQLEAPGIYQNQPLNEKRKDFYSDFHPGDPLGAEERTTPTFKESIESTDWKYLDGKENLPTQSEKSAFRRYQQEAPGDDPFAQLNPPVRHSEKMGSFDSDQIPSYSDLPDQEAMQAQDPIDQYKPAQRQMKLRPKEVKTRHELKKPVAGKSEMKIDDDNTLRSTSTNTSTLKSFATDTLGSTTSWGKYDPFINPSAFAPEVGLELKPKWQHDERKSTMSGMPPQRSLSDPSDHESSKGREIKPYNRSKTSPGAVPSVSVHAASPGSDWHSKRHVLNRDTWVDLEARHPLRAPTSASSSSNIKQIEIVSTGKAEKSNTSTSESWRYNKAYGDDMDNKDTNGKPERDILEEHGVFFSKPATSEAKKNFDEIREREMSRKKLIYRKSNSDTKITIQNKPERPKTLNIQLEFPMPDADLRRTEVAKLRVHKVRQLSESAMAVKSEHGPTPQEEIKELSRTGLKIASIKSLFNSDRKCCIMHPIPIKTRNFSAPNLHRFETKQGITGDEYLINISKETKVKKTPNIPDHLAELEGLFAELDLDNEDLLTNAEKRERSIHQSHLSQMSIRPNTELCGLNSIDLQDMPSLEYAREWLSKENQRIMKDAADFENMLHKDVWDNTENDEVFLKDEVRDGHCLKQSEADRTKDRKGAIRAHLTRPLHPRKIADDMLTRKIALSNINNSPRSLLPTSPISFLALNPAWSQEANVENLTRRPRSPDAVLDDVNFRKIQMANSKTRVDCRDVNSKPSPTTADYLRERTTPPVRPLRRYRPTKTSDIQHDDLAYRQLRKDIQHHGKGGQNARPRSMSLDDLAEQLSASLGLPPDGRSVDTKTRRMRKTSLSKGMANLVEYFDSSEDSHKSVVRLSNSLPDLSKFRTELSVDFDDRGNIISGDPKYIQHARHPKKTPRAVKMKSRLRHRYSDSMDDSETGDSDRSGSVRFGVDSRKIDSDGTMSGSEDASHEFEVGRSRSVTSQSHDSDRTSDLESRRSEIDWGKQGSARFERTPALEPDVFNTRKQTDESIKDWYNSHEDSFHKRLGYFESGGARTSLTSLRKSASHDNLSGHTARVESRQSRARQRRKGKKNTIFGLLSYGSDPCLSERRTRDQQSGGQIDNYRSVLHFSVPLKKDD